MTRPSEIVRRDDAATTIGPDPADPSATISLPDSAFASGCYVEGADQDLRGALLDSWCVQWAEAGYGFCYVHPGGSAPRELLARLPAERLDDVVWIDVDRSRHTDRLDVPAQRRVTIDLFDAPEPDPETFELDPVNARVNAYLDAFAEHPAFDWNVARVLSSVLPAVFLRDDVSHTDVSRALESKELEALSDSLDSSGGGGHPDDGRRILAAAGRAMDGVVDRAGDPAGDAAWLLDRLAESRPQDLLVGDGSYDVGRAILEDDIVVVTGAMPGGTDGETTGYGETAGYEETTGDVARLRTHLLVGALCCRLQEVAAFAPPASSMFPLVLDGFEDLLAGEGDPFQRLLRTSHELPLAPVFSGLPPSDLEEAVGLAIGDHVTTRVVVTDEVAQEPEPDFDPEREPYRTSALGPGSIDVVGRYLEREALDALPEAPLCWCRVNANDRAAGVESSQESVQPAVVPTRPERRRPPEEVAAVIARSVDRHGTNPE